MQNLKEKYGRIPQLYMDERRKKLNQIYLTTYQIIQSFMKSNKNKFYSDFDKQINIRKLCTTLEQNQNILQNYYYCPLIIVIFVYKFHTLNVTTIETEVVILT